MDMANKEETPAAKLPCGITEEQLKGWKAQYGKDNIKVISLDHNGKLYEGIFRQPDFDVICKAQKHLTNQEVFNAGLIYFLECQLAIDEDVMKVHVVKAAFCLKLATLFELKVADIKNL